MDSTKQSIFFHERPVVELKFHKDGDVFFAASKDAVVSMFNTEGKALGSFDSHKGAISAIGVAGNRLVTAGTDLLVAMWDILTGSMLFSTPAVSVIRGISFENQLYFCTDNSMDKEVFVGMLDPRMEVTQKLADLPEPATKLFQSGNDLIIATVYGDVYRFDIRNAKILQESRIHQTKITDMKASPCGGFFVTSSSDSSAKILDMGTFATKKRFDSEEPINAVGMFRTNDIVMCAGGTNARDVTTTSGKGMFETSFFDVVTQERIGYYSTHFGTINALDVHPEGTCYISGGEDSSICLVRIGDDLRNAPFTQF